MARQDRCTTSSEDPHGYRIQEADTRMMFVHDQRMVVQHAAQTPLLLSQNSFDLQVVIQSDATMYSAPILLYDEPKSVTFYVARSRWVLVNLKS